MNLSEYMAVPKFVHELAAAESCEGEFETEDPESVGFIRAVGEQQPGAQQGGSLEKQLLFVCLLQLHCS